MIPFCPKTCSPLRAFRSIFLLASLLLPLSIANAQNVLVSGALVGNGLYPTVGAAFTAINGGSQTGASIIVALLGNTTEPGTATLNQGTWTTLGIIPTGGAARTIQGNVAGPLLDFVGADRVLVDGLNSGGSLRRWHGMGKRPRRWWWRVSTAAWTRR